MEKIKTFKVSRPSEKIVARNWVWLWKSNNPNDHIEYSNYFHYYDDRLIRRKPTDIIVGKTPPDRLRDLIKRGYKVYQVINGDPEIIRLVKVESRSRKVSALDDRDGESYHQIEIELLYDNRSVANLTKAEAKHLHNVATQHKVVLSSEEEDVMNAMLNEAEKHMQMRAKGETVFQDHEMYGRPKCLDCNQPATDSGRCYWHDREAHSGYFDAKKKPAYPWEHGYEFGTGDPRPLKPTSIGQEALIEMGLLDRSEKPLRKAEKTCKHGLRVWECGACLGHRSWKDPYDDPFERPTAVDRQFQLNEIIFKRGGKPVGGE